jgi:hypothetical protein
LLIVCEKLQLAVLAEIILAPLDGSVATADYGSDQLMSAGGPP